MSRSLTALTLGLSLFCFGCGDTKDYVPLEENVGGSTCVTSDGGSVPEGGSGGAGGSSVLEGGFGGGSEPLPEPTPISFDNLPPSSQAAIDYATALVKESNGWQNKMEWYDPRVGLRFYSNPLDGGCHMQKSSFGKEAMEILYEGDVFVRCMDPGTKKHKYECIIEKIHEVPVFKATRVEFRPTISESGDKDILDMERSEGVIKLEDLSGILDLKSTYNP